MNPTAIRTEEQTRTLDRFRVLLLERNKHVNLTRVTDPDEIAAKHFEDSLSLLPYLPETGAVIDVGSGAGFPGMPLAVLRPGLRFTLLDAQRKRVDFLREAASALGLKNVTVLHARAEDAARFEACREQFDIATARAVATLPGLAELCLPFVRPGGLFLAMKGPDPAAEAEEAAAAIQTLGGGETETVSAGLSGMAHSIIIIRKLTQTPLAYPRKPAKIRKSPLK